MHRVGSKNGSLIDISLIILCIRIIWGSGVNCFRACVGNASYLLCFSIIMLLLTVSFLSKKIRKSDLLLTVSIIAMCLQLNG